MPTLMTRKTFTRESSIRAEKFCLKEQLFSKEKKKHMIIILILFRSNPERMQDYIAVYLYHVPILYED